MHTFTVMMEILDHGKQEYALFFNTFFGRFVKFQQDRLEHDYMPFCLTQDHWTFEIINIIY